jgi:hypothetical protein
VMIKKRRTLNSPFPMAKNLVQCGPCGKLCAPPF